MSEKRIVSAEQLNRLYTTRNTAGWAKEQLRILSDMLEYKDRDQEWILKEVKRISEGIEII
jgi:hypothetical protein